MIKLYKITFIIGGICYGLLLTYAWQSNLASQQLKISFLDVGQGDAIYIELPDKVSIVVDGGPDNSLLWRLGEVMPWWQHRIDYLLITHADLDHYAGFLGVIEKYQVGQVWFNGDNKATAYYQALLNRVKELNIPIDIIGQGDTFVWPSGATLEIIWPDPDYDLDETNAISIVAMLRWQNIQFLLTGDVGQREELELIDNYQALRSNVLKVGHHGSKNSSHISFLKAVKADYCIISAGLDNNFGHPHQEVVEKLNNVICQIISTIDEGTISFVSDGSSIKKINVNRLPI